MGCSPLVDVPKSWEREDLEKLFKFCRDRLIEIVIDSNPNEILEVARSAMDFPQYMEFSSSKDCPMGMKKRSCHTLSKDEFLKLPTKRPQFVNVCIHDFDDAKEESNKAASNDKHLLQE